MVILLNVFKPILLTITCNLSNKQLEDLAQGPFDRLGKPGVDPQLFLTGRQPTLHPEEHRHCLNNAGASQFLVDVFIYLKKKHV